MLAAPEEICEADSLGRRDNVVAELMVVANIYI